MPEHTVLILGAGASLAYGLPLGSGLVAKICELLPAENHLQHQPAVEVILQAIMRDEIESLSHDTIDRWAEPGYRAIENDFEITHPYGTLGSFLEDSFAKAKDWLNQAQHVIFLGFSFDSINMERLGLAQGLKPSYLSDKGHVVREVHPLTYGFERAERSALIAKYFSEFLFTSAYRENPQNDKLTVSETHSAMPITQYLRRYGGLMKI